MGSFARKSIAAVVVGVAMLLAVPFAAAQTAGTNTGWTTGTSADVYTGATVGNGSGSHAFIATDQAAGTFSFSTISVTGRAKTEWDELAGFFYITQSASAPSLFTGRITGGNISINTSVGSAFGAMFRDVAATPPPTGWWSTIDTGADINLGKITVKSTDGGSSLLVGREIGAVGFIAGDLDGGNVKIDNIYAEAKGFAFGAKFGNVKNGTFTVNHGLTAKSTGEGEAVGFLVDGNLEGGTISIKKGNAANAIEVSSTNTTGWDAGAYGILVRKGDPLVPSVTEGTITGGRIDVDGNIVVSTDSPGLAAGIGVVGGVGGNVKVAGNITATAVDGQAVGFGANGFMGTGGQGGLDAGKTVEITGTTTAIGGLEATGVRFTGDVAGALKTGDINVISENGNAYGVHIAQGGISGSGEFGTITVEATNKTGAGGGGSEPTAAGIWTAGNSTFTLKGNVTAIGAGDSAYGVFVEGADADITIAAGKNVEVLATGADDNIGIHVGQELTINLGNSANLTTNSVTVGTDLNVNGNGSADLGIVNVSSIINIGGSGNDKTTVALDVANSTFGNTTSNTITSSAKLEVYGDAASGQFSQDQKIVGFNNLGADFANKAIFTDYQWKNGSSGIGVYYMGTRNSAYMSDGYLAAFTMHNRFAAWYSVRDHLISGDGSAFCAPHGYGNGHGRGYGHGHGHYRGQAPCSCTSCVSFDCDPCGPVSYQPCDPVGCDPCDPVSFGACDPCGPAGYSVRNNNVARNAWVNYVGRGDEYQSSYNGRNWKLSTVGVQTGTDLIRTRRGQLGVLFGYEDGKTTNASDRVNMDDMYVGAYVARVFRRGADFRGVFAYGWQDYDMSRFGNGTLYTSSFKGSTMEANLELGKRLSAGAWSLRPVIAADLFTNKTKSAKESAGPGGVTYDKINLTQMFLRTGTELRYQRRSFTFNSGVYYAYDLRGKALQTYVTSIDTPTLGAPLRGTKLGRELLTFNLGGEYWLAQNLSIFGGYQGEYVMDRANSKIHTIGYAGAGWRW